MNARSRPGLFYFWGDRALYLGPDVVASLHAHHALQVCIGLSAPAQLRSGSTPGRTYPGAVIPPHQPHATDAAIDLIATFWLDSDTADARRLLPSRTGDIQSIRKTTLKQVVPLLLACWHEGWDSRRAVGLLDDVVQHLAPAQATVRAIDPRAARARDVLRAAPDRRLSLKELATAVSLSPSRTEHLFSSEIGIPARRYLVWLRLRDAVAALGNGASITTAAHAAGFADAAHLSRTFRRMLGFTPSTALRVSQFVQDSPRART